MTAAAIAVYSTSSISDIRFHTDARVAAAMVREGEMLGNPELASFSTSPASAEIEETRRRRERQLEVAELLKSWLAAPDATADANYDILEGELKNSAARFREG